MWRTGVCTGKDTGIKQTEREMAEWLLVIKNKPGHGQKKEGGYAKNEKLKPRCGRGRKYFTKPSAFESEIHPSHKLCLYLSEKDSEFLKNNNYTKEEVLSGFKQLLMQSGYTDLLCLVKDEE